MTFEELEDGHIYRKTYTYRTGIPHKGPFVRIKVGNMVWCAGKIYNRQNDEDSREFCIIDNVVLGRLSPEKLNKLKAKFL